MKAKLCYVLPEYESHSETRYYYIWEFLEMLSKYFDITLFIETAGERLTSKNFSIYRQKFTFPPLNLFERLVVFLWLRAKGYRIFYIHYSIFSSLIAGFIGKFWKLRTFYWNCQMRHLYSHPWWENMSFWLNLKLVNFLVTGNNSMAKYFTSYFNVPAEKIKVIPNWVNISRFQKEIKDKEKIKEKLGLKNEKIVLFVHWLSKRKGADKIIPVLKMVCKGLKNVKFIVVGDGPLFKMIQSKANKNSYLANRILLLGKRGQVEIAQFFIIADVFFMPSKEEEFGRVILEAMAAGLPIIATDTLGPQAIFGPRQRKFLIPVNNIREFSDKILNILNDTNISKRLISENQRIIRKYDTRTIAKQFCQLTEN